MLRTESLSLSGYTYQVTAIPARTGTRVAARLANALAPAVKALPEEGFEMNAEQLAAFIAPILQDPSLGDTLDYLIGVFSAQTTVTDESNNNTQPLARAFDIHFADKYDDMLSWLVFALQLSMSSFFRVARDHAVRAAVAQSNSKSPRSAGTTGSVGA